MAIALVSTPTYPAAGSSVTLSITGGAGTVVVWELTSAPDSSALSLGLLIDGVDENDTAPIAALDVAEQELNTESFTPDVAGEYGFTAYDIRQVIAIPQYAGDPSGDQRWELLATGHGTIHVGDYTDLPIVAESGDGATLRLLVVDTTVRGASLVDSTTDLARVAALDATTVAALAALVGVAVGSVGTALTSGVNDLLSNYAGHRATVVGPPNVHPSADNQNTCNRDDADSDEGAILVLNELRDVLIAHCQNSTATGGSWHREDDYSSTPVAGPATDRASATVLSADMRERVYERHRVLDLADGDNPAPHNTNDTANPLAAPTVLDTAIISYLDALAIANPTPPAGEAEGLADMAHAFGFRLYEPAS